MSFHISSLRNNILQQSTSIISKSSRQICTSTTNSRRRYNGTNNERQTSYIPRGPKQVFFIPHKMKEEILGLHFEDDKRWTATTLSARFGAPYENVAGLLALGALRRQREKVLETMDEETTKKIEHFRDKGIEEWDSISNVSPYISSPSTYYNKRKEFIPISSPSSNEHVNGELNISIVKGEDQDQKENIEQKSDENENKLPVVKSKWAEYIENNLDNVETDTVRRTSFAFIETGRKVRDNKVIERAIWIREGSTGKLRIANEEEKKLLRRETKVRDSIAFLKKTAQ